MDSEGLAKTLGLQVIQDPFTYPFVKDKVAIIPYLLAKESSYLPLCEEEDKVVVATSDPLNIDSLTEIRLLLKKEIELFFCPKGTLEAAIESIYQQDEEDLFSDHKSNNEQKKKEAEIEGYDLLEKATGNPVIRLLNAILTEAIRQKASDIHFEPLENSLLVRFRIDGVLQKRRSPPAEYTNQVLTRIKVMASLDIAETRLPQDGRIKLKMGQRQIDFRVSTLPVVHGERIVLRILDKGQIDFGLNYVGMDKNILKKIRELIHTPEGIVLVTGPTGSGKTTTLYSALSEIDSAKMNIMTIEDPVEYKLQKIAQIAVNPKINLTFATGLRHILRQDPDVVMIGEIRDHETAQIAIQSALTGHLVLSTLHTNDAPSALTRLADMGIEPYLLSSSVIGVLAQRLVRRICPDCKESYKLSEEEKEKLGLFEKKELSICRGKGCSSCFHTGYKGRVGIYELMPITSRIKKQVVKSPDADELRKIFLEEGGRDLRKSAVNLMLDGVTSIEEVFRVTKLNTMD